jgi:protein gp37
MAENSSIEWTDCTWNPVTGCTRVSPGCDSCYAATMTYRLESMGQPKYTGLTVLNKAGDRHFNGKVLTHDDALDIPLKWKKPRRVFVNSMSDLFHRDVPFGFVDKVFAVMALCPQHTFQILTKRPERMAEFFARGGVDFRAMIAGLKLAPKGMKMEDTGLAIDAGCWKLPNVWLGTSIENQQAADERIPHLLKVPAAVRFLSVEPLLGAVDLVSWLPYQANRGYEGEMPPKIDWVIVGCESGPHARPMDIAWARFLRDQCKDGSVPFFMKQMVVGGKLTGELPEFPEDLRVREFPTA